MENNVNKVNSLKELADLVGVSPASVSLVLNNKWQKKVKPEIVEKVHRLCAKHNFSLNPLGKGLMLKKFFRIGLIVEGSLADHPIMGALSFHDFISKITTKLNEAGYALDIIQVDMEVKARIIAEKRLSFSDDAFIFIGWQTDSIIQLLKTIYLEKPYLVFDNDLKDPTLSYIYKDFETQSFKAIEHFIKNGHQQIAFIRGEKSQERYQLKLKGYRKALEKYNISYNPAFIISDDNDSSIKHGYEMAKRLFSHNKDVTAIYCTDNLCSLGIMWYLDTVNYRIPDDIELIGYGDEAVIKQGLKPLSFIQIPSKEFSEFCIRKIVEWTDNNTAFKPVQKCFVEKLLLQQTTRNN